jgi:hypothetical protein
MLSIILILLVILFVEEVLLGSSTEVYNAEIGYEAKCDQPTRLSIKQFFTELVPIITLCLILPSLLLSDVF